MKSKKEEPSINVTKETAKKMTFKYVENAMINYKEIKSKIGRIK